MTGTAFRDQLEHALLAIPEDIDVLYLGWHGTHSHTSDSDFIMPAKYLDTCMAYILWPQGLVPASTGVCKKRPVPNVPVEGFLKTLKVFYWR